VVTAAYHLSVLKPVFHSGMNVPSLLWYGGAEVALHGLGIPLKNVVSMDISPVNRKILDDWRKLTDQKAKLIHVADVQMLDDSMVDRWIKGLNGFDLVIGGCPCNNRSGGNRRTRDGPQGEHSSLFFHYYRILERVRSIVRR